MFTDAWKRKGGPRRSLRKKSQKEEEVYPMTHGSQVLHMFSRDPAFSEKSVIHWPSPTSVSFTSPNSHPSHYHLNKLQ